MLVSSRKRSDTVVTTIKLELLFLAKIVRSKEDMTGYNVSLSLFLAIPLSLGVPNSVEPLRTNGYHFVIRWRTSGLQRLL